MWLMNDAMLHPGLFANIKCWCWNEIMMCIGAICNCQMPTLNMIQCCALAQTRLVECQHKLYEMLRPGTVKLSKCTNVKKYVILHLVAFTYCMVCHCNCYMIRALALLQSLWCNDIKLFNRAPNAIAIALLAIWIVKANKNGISYGNTIELIKVW